MSHSIRTTKMKMKNKQWTYVELDKRLTQSTSTYALGALIARADDKALSVLKEDLCITGELRRIINIELDLRKTETKGG